MLCGGNGLRSTAVPVIIYLRSVKQTPEYERLKNAITFGSAEAQHSFQIEDSFVIFLILAGLSSAEDPGSLSEHKAT